jgi:hypothetical protein
MSVSFFKCFAVLTWLQWSIVVNAQEITPKLLIKIKANEYKLDKYNEDGVFLAKIKKTKKWGMYQLGSENNAIMMIPPLYDSIDFFRYNGLITGVWNDGKVGIYTCSWTYGDEDAKQTVPCLFEGYRIFNIEKNIPSFYGNYTKTIVYVAVKQGGLWAWIDWMTGELKTDFTVDLDKESMPYPEFEQEN